MNTIRLTFNSSTNLTIPISTYWTINRDAFYYGYIKNDKPNIGGFLNDLIPALVSNQDDLYKELLKYNNGDERDAQLAVRNIYNVYLRRYVHNSDGTATVPFRISKDKYNDFIHIHDERLAFYDMDFSKYLRMILIEYAAKSLSDREKMYAYHTMNILSFANSKSRICKVYYGEECNELVPVSIQTSPVYDHNYLVGVTKYEQSIIIRLRDIKRIVVTNDKLKVTQEMCDKLYDLLDEIYDEEFAECSD